MNGRYSKAERRHVALVKSLSCGVCGTAGPSAAHHLRQHQHFTVVPLCYDCHQGPHGIHGDKTRWRIYKVDELSVLNHTIGRAYGG